MNIFRESFILLVSSFDIGLQPETRTALGPSCPKALRRPVIAGQRALQFVLRELGEACEVVDLA